MSSDEPTPRERSGGTTTVRDRPEVDGPAPRLTLTERAERTDEANRDCRGCRAFESAGGDAGYGHCRAFDMFVKLYHPPGAFYSQCQFQVLTRVVSD